MPKTATGVRNLALAAALVAALPTTTAADETVRIEVQHALATPDTSNTSNVATYKLQFDLRLTNRSAKPMNVPSLDTADSDTTRIVVLGVQSKLLNGPWTNVIQSSWYGSGTEKYDSCKSLPPAGTAEIGGVTNRLVLLKTQLASLGGEPAIRFYIMMFCRQPDGKVTSTTVPTEGFNLRLPPLPGN